MKLRKRGEVGTEEEKSEGLDDKMENLTLSHSRTSASLSATKLEFGIRVDLSWLLYEVVRADKFVQGENSANAKICWKNGGDYHGGKGTVKSYCDIG